MTIKLKHLLPFILLTFFSCEKIIELDLNSVNTKVVIEANIDNESGPYKVKVQKTVNYDTESEDFVASAIVVMTDLENGSVDTFTYVSNGEYQSNTIQGIIGNRYRCDVTIDGTTYSQTSKINSLVKIDTVIALKVLFPLSTDSSYLVASVFTDPPTLDNYYRTYFDVKTKSGNLFKPSRRRIYLTDDPDKNQQNILNRRFTDNSLKKGDTIKVQLRHITKESYDYFFTLREIVSGGFASQGIPDNPIITWSNGAIGYFSANAVSKKQVILP